MNFSMIIQTLLWVLFHPFQYLFYRKTRNNPALIAKYLQTFGVGYGNLDLETSDEVKAKIVQKLKEDPAFFARVVMDFHPFKYQMNLLRSAAKRIIACWGRQTGKTTIVAIKAIHFAITHKNVVVLIVSPGIRQSMIMFERINSFMQDIPVLRATINRSTKTQIKLNNKSRIIALPCSQDGATLRGYTADLVIMDEAAFMPETVIANVIFPMLATTETTRGTGIAIMISTPWGRNHIFYRMTMSKDYFYSHIKSKESPLIPKKFLVSQRKEIGELRFRIEYEAEFVDDATQLFTADIIRIMIEDDHYASRLKNNMLELMSDKEVLLREHPRKGQFIMGLDLGKRRDHTVLTVFKRAKRRIVIDPDDEMPDFATTNVPTKTIDDAWILVYMKRFDLKLSYNNVIIPFVKQVYSKFTILGGWVDQSGPGESVMEVLTKDCPGLSGVVMTIGNKHQIMMWYHSMCERGRVGIPNDPIIIAEHIEQNFGFSSKKTTRLEDVLDEEGLMRFWHPEGRHDDILWGCTLAIFAVSGEMGEWSIS